ncbi:MAG: hypothetical protein HC859_05000, partial [Bacteroidia bacterium]|nr:hypothetical protein [Bacteroidia bacterium]
MTVTSGNCTPRTAQVQITFNQFATATAIADFTACFEPGPTFPPIDVSGTITVTPNGRWEVVSGAGTIQSSGAPIGNSIAAATINDRYVPAAADYTSGGSVTVRLVALDPDGPLGPCTSQSDDVVITIERRPSNVNAGADQPNVCTDSTDLAALVPMFGTGTWSSSNGAVIIDDPLDPQSRVRNLPIGVPVTFTWTVASLGALCADVTDNVVVTRQPLPTVLNINPATVCEDVLGGPVETNNIDLTVYNDAVTTVPAANRLVTWFDISNNNLGATPPPQNNVVTGTVYIARVQDITTTCTNDGTITFSVTQLPDASNATVQVCEDSPAGSNTATGVDLTQYEADVIGTSTNVTVSWYDDITEAMNGTANTIPGATVDVAGARQVFARIVDNNPPGCSAVAELNLLVKPLPTNAAIFGKTAVCVGDPLTPPDELPVEIYQVTPVSGAQYIWDIPDDPATEFKVFGGGTSNDFFVLLQFPNVFTGDIRVRVELNGCGGVDLVKNIAVSPSPTAPPLT